jgi:hypothetical protein
MQDTAHTSNFTRIFLAALCLVPGIGLLIPIGLYAWTSLKSHLAPKPHAFLRPEEHFTLMVGGKEFDTFTTLLILSIAGVALCLIGILILPRRRMSE